MHVGNHGQGLAQGTVLSRMAAHAETTHKKMNHDDATRGERTVARHDKNDDGMLSVAELSGTKLGRHMSIDQFARIDANQDFKLDAGEIDAMRHKRRGYPVSEGLIKARLADHLAETVEDDNGNAEVAARLLRLLDGDESGGLNSEEIAGTRLAKAIGDDFYGLDADKSGALDQAELTSFINKLVLGISAEVDDGPADDALAKDKAPAVTFTEDEAPDTVSFTQSTDIAAPAIKDTMQEVGAANSAPAVEPAAGFGPVDVQADGPASRAESIRIAFEAALKILQDGSASGTAYDVVQALYSDVQQIFGRA